MATTDSDTEVLEWLVQLRPHRDPYEYLIHRKFPDYTAMLLSLGNIGRSGISHGYRDRRLKEVESFRAELKAKPLKEIKTLCEEERQALAAKADLEEEQRFFNQPDANADFIHWDDLLDLR